MIRLMTLSALLLGRALGARVSTVASPRFSRVVPPAKRITLASRSRS